MKYRELGTTGISLSALGLGAMRLPGFEYGGQELTLQCIHTFLLQQNLTGINDGFPFSHSGATIVSTAREDKTGLLTVSSLVA